MDTYAAQRVPGALLDELIGRGADVEVHGIYPEHLPLVFPQARLLHAGHSFGPEKVFNVVRPQYFVVPGAGRERLIAAVPPGRDYVLHNASLIQHYLRARGLPRTVPAAIVRYPVAEDAIADWTHLDDFVRPGARVLLGYVRELLPLLLEDGARVLERRSNRFYGAASIRFPNGEDVCLLGVRFSFWGCIAARLTSACQRQCVAEIVYAGKLGTLTTPLEIYDRLFVPSAYLVGGSELGVIAAGAVPNGLLKVLPHLDAGTHLSVGTVLEEDLRQRAYADRYGVRTIDNEIAQMASALAQGAHGHRTAFSALHFATDYLRRAGDPEPVGVYNLTNHRVHGALELKRRMLARMARLLRRYYGTTSGRAGELSAVVDGQRA